MVPTTPIKQCVWASSIILTTLVAPRFAFIAPNTKVQFRIDHIAEGDFMRNVVVDSARNDDSENVVSPSQLGLLKSLLHSITIFSIAGSISLGTAYADEYGVETEAPTLFTGESVLICVKRGPLGACQKTKLRTAQNDNDKASKYFVEPGKNVEDKDAAMRKVVEEDNPYIAKLIEQSKDNTERNEKLVKKKTLENDMAATFGPFDRQTAIMNADEEGYTILQNPQAMRLKKLGYIKDRKFITQPTDEVINDALEASESGFGGFLKGILGRGDDIE